MEIIKVLETLGITKEDIIDRAVEHLADIDRGEIMSVIRSEVQKEIAKTAPAVITKALTEAVDNILNLEYQQLDEWGDPKKGQEKTTLRELVKKKALGFLNEKVDSRGEPNSYNGTMTRSQYMANKAAVETFHYEAQKEVAEAVKQASGQLTKLVAEYIQNLLLKS